VVFVAIGAKRDDKFYILTWRALRDLLMKGHKAYLTSHGGVRPKKWDSFHGAIQDNVLAAHLARLRGFGQ
jgi:hypothetical protein